MMISVLTAASAIWPVSILATKLFHSTLKHINLRLTKIVLDVVYVLQFAQFLELYNTDLDLPSILMFLREAISTFEDDLFIEKYLN